MSAFLPRARTSSTRLLASTAAILAAAGGFAACADSLHLDPPGTSGGGGNTTTSQHTGGTSPGGCISSQDCGYPKAICDTVKAECVECVTHIDCSAVRPGTVCSFGVCSCPAEGDAAATVQFCESPGAGGARCVDTATASSDCGGCNKPCYGSCVNSKCADPWRPITSDGAPSPRSRHVGVWASSVKRMFIWGGRSSSGVLDTGGLYDPETNTWKPTPSLGAPSPRHGATAVWDDKENVVIVWGGLGPADVPLNSGAIYDPATDQWTAMPTLNVPTARSAHSAVWATFTAPYQGASHGMIVWGGDAGGFSLGDGALFDPAGAKWSAVDNTNGPSARHGHSAVWHDASQKMIIFGGVNVVSPAETYFAEGWTFAPATSTWTNVSGSLPDARARHTAVLTNASSMIVFGGFNGVQLPDGAAYLISTSAWAPLDPFTSPHPREGHTALWLGTRMIVVGGEQNGNPHASAWAYDPVATTWVDLASLPVGRTHHTAVTDGTVMMVWGGDGSSGPLDSGAIYTP